MQWHKIFDDDFPQEFKRVLVAYWNMDDQYDEEAMMLCYRRGDKWIYGANDCCFIEDDDRWAYIELPEEQEMKYDYNKELSWAFSNIIEPEVLGAIVNAINKQLPSKPYYRKEEDAEGWACPNCDMGVEHDHGRIKDTYCHSCGQMLDWEDA